MHLLLSLRESAVNSVRFELTARFDRSEVPKRTVTERAASPLLDEPATKRARQEDAIADDTPVTEVAVTVEPVADVDVSIKVEPVADVDVSTLPADVVGTMGKTAPFKEDPFTYLSPEDEQVKTCLCVVRRKSLLIC